MLSTIKIALLDETQRIWFVRSDAGTYAPHFRSGELIATDYLSDIFDESKLTELPSHEEIRRKLLSNEKFSEFKYDKKEDREVKILNAAGAKRQAAINKFKTEISPGDLVVTKTSAGGFMFGICSFGEAYVSSVPVTLAAAEAEGATFQDKIKLKYSLRKSVVWGPTVREGEIPKILKNSLARNTLTEISHLKEIVYHLLYPFFTDGKNLYFSNRIRSTEEINSAVIGKLFQNISMVGPLVSAILSGNDINPSELIAEVERSIFSDAILSTSKADFMSPGNTWSKIPLLGSMTPQTLATAVVACLLVTGMTSIHDMETALTEAAYASKASEANDESPPAKSESKESDGLFNDKFKDGEDGASAEIERINESLRRQHKALTKLSDDTYAKAINDSLKLEVAQPQTAKLENFEYGIKLQNIWRR